MDSKYLVPFIKSTKTMFQTMFQMDVEVGEPSIKPPDAVSFDVSGIIGFSGDVEGSIVLTFTESTANRIAQLLTGEDLAGRSDDLCDAIGELANMVAGGAKAQLDGMQVAITCPNVVMGKSHTVMAQRDLPCICVPCTCDCGEFMMEIGIRASQTANTAAAGA